MHSSRQDIRGNLTVFAGGRALNGPDPWLREAFFLQCPSFSPHSSSFEVRKCDHASLPRRRLSSHPRLAADIPARAATSGRRFAIE